MMGNVKNLSTIKPIGPIALNRRAPKWGTCCKDDEAEVPDVKAQYAHRSMSAGSVLLGTDLGQGGLLKTGCRSELR